MNMKRKFQRGSSCKATSVDEEDPINPKCEFYRQPVFEKRTGGPAYPVMPVYMRY